MPIEPIEQYLARTKGRSPVRPFQSVTPPGGEDPGILAGFLGSAVSAVPELFGAPPSQTAEAFRQQHPILGFGSELAGFAVPYLGAEKIAQLPSVAPRLAAGVEGILGRFGLEAAAAPVRAGITRELIVNAPVEASRLAVGSIVYPENQDLWSDVALSYALTGGVGGLAGYLRAGGKALTKQAAVKGADLFLAPTHQLKMVLDGAPVANTTPEEFIPQLRRQVLEEVPPTGGASKKTLDYVLPLEGMTAEQSKGVNSLFEAGRQLTEVAEGETPELTGLVKQYLIEGRGKNQLRTGEQQSLLDMLPESFQTIDDVAKEVQYPRKVTVADKEGARQFSGIMSNPQWQKVGDRLHLMQERDGAFVFAYKLADGQGQALGKAAGRTKAGAQYLIGKTTNPGAFDPAAKKMADLVTAKWAKWGAAFAPARYADVFNENQDMFIKAMSVLDYHNMTKMPEGQWKQAFKEKLGRMMAKEEGLLDSKFGYKDSKTLQDMTDWAYATFKPTEFLQRQNPVYGRMFGLMRNAQRVADNYATRIMRGAAKTKPGSRMTRGVSGKDTEYVSAFMGHEPINNIVTKENLTEDEVNLIWNLSGTDKLGDEGLEQLIKEGVMSPKGAQAVRELRSINEDVLGNLIMPVFRETGHEVDWLKNHLGIPHTPRGDLFYHVVDENGKIKHLAFGKTGAQAEREAKVVIEEAKNSGRNWKYEAASPKHIAAESEDALDKLHKQVMTNVQNTAEEGELIYRAMRRLSAIKATSGRNPTVPASSGMFNKRSGVSTSYGRERVTHEDLLNAMDGHLRQLLRFAGMQSWRERFGSVAAHMLQKQDPKLFSDLMRKSGQMLGLEGKLTNWLNETMAPVLGSTLGSKAATKTAAAVNEFMYAWNLGFVNPTFALLNLLTPLQTVAPWLAHMQVATREDLARTMFMDLMPDRTSPTGVAAWLNPLKILGQSIQLMRAPTPELRAFFDQALDDGLFHPQLFEEWIGSHTRAQQTFKQAWQEGPWQLLRKGSTYLGEQSEKLSRLSAFNSAYILGKNFFNLEGDALYRFMRRGTEVTMYNYATIDRSRIFTGPIGSMFGLFKNWQMHFMGQMLQYSGLALSGRSFAPLTWTVGSALALGGLGATPLVAIADGLANWNEKGSNSFLWTQKHFDPLIGDAVYYGLPAFMGVSLQASSAIPGTDVRNEAASLFSFAIWQRSKQMADVVAQMAVDKATTGNAFHDDNLKDKLVGATMPRAVNKLYSAIESDYVRSMTTGSPQVRDVSPFARMLHGMGMNTVEIEQWQDASRYMYKDQERRRDIVTGLGRAYANARMNKDWDELERISMRAIAAGEFDSVLKSAATRLRREEEGDILSRYRKSDRAAYDQYLKAD